MSAAMSSATASATAVSTYPSIVQEYDKIQIVLDQLNQQRTRCLLQQKKLKPTIIEYLKMQPKGKISFLRANQVESSMRYRRSTGSKTLTKDNVIGQMRGAFDEWLKHFIVEVKKSNNPAFLAYLTAKMTPDAVTQSAQLMFEYIWANLPVKETDDICFPAKKKETTTKRTSTKK